MNDDGGSGRGSESRAAQSRWIVYQRERFPFAAHARWGCGVQPVGSQLLGAAYSAWPELVTLAPPATPAA